VEDAGDGIVAAQEQGSNLAGREPLVSEQNHLEAEAGFGVVGVVEATRQLGEGGLVERRKGKGSWHGRDPF